MSKSEVAAWILIGAALLMLFVDHLVPAFIVGLVFFLFLDSISVFLEKRLQRRFVRPVALVTAVSIAVALLAGAIALVVHVIHLQAGNIPALMNKMAEILESTRVLLLRFGGYQLFPYALGDAEDLKTMVVHWLKMHSEVLSIAGERFGMTIVHGVMAILLGVMIFLRHVSRADGTARGPLAHHLTDKLASFTRAFSQVVSAQVKISAINTTLTAVYLLVILPLAGRKLPFSATIIFVTFVCGLIPILGNLISNSVIVIVSLGVSTGTAIASLVFLVLIHKLEYIVNSKIVGGKTDSQAWEILMAIVIGDVAAGVPGIVMAPIIYTFVKRELREKGLV